MKQLTSICLEEWPTYEDEKTVSNTDSLMRPERYHPQVFYDTACYQRMKTEVKDRQFNAYFKGLENRLGELAVRNPFLFSKINNIVSNTPKKEYIEYQDKRIHAPNYSVTT